MIMDLHNKTKKRKKNQEPKNGIFKKNVYLSSKNKTQIVLLFYPSCLNEKVGNL